MIWQQQAWTAVRLVSKGWDRKHKLHEDRNSPHLVLVLSNNNSVGHVRDVRYSGKFEWMSGQKLPSSLFTLDSPEVPYPKDYLPSP